MLIHPCRLGININHFDMLKSHPLKMKQTKRTYHWCVCVSRFSWSNGILFGTTESYFKVFLNGCLNIVYTIFRCNFLKQSYHETILYGFRTANIKWTLQIIVDLAKVFPKTSKRKRVAQILFCCGPTCYWHNAMVLRYWKKWASLLFMGAQWFRQYSIMCADFQIRFGLFDCFWSVEEKFPIN